MSGGSSRSRWAEPGLEAVLRARWRGSSAGRAITGAGGEGCLAGAVRDRLRPSLAHQCAELPDSLELDIPTPSDRSMRCRRVRRWRYRANGWQRMGRSHFRPPPSGPRLRAAVASDHRSAARRSSGGACARRRSTVPAVLAVLSGLPRDAVLLADRGTATPADIDIAMRLGAGHPPGRSRSWPVWTPTGDVTSDCPPGCRRRSRPTPADAPARDWTGPVGVLATGQMAGAIAEAVARSGRPVRGLARTEGSGGRLLATPGKSLDRALTRGRLDETGKAEVRGRASVTQDPTDLAGSDVVVEAVAEDSASRPPSWSGPTPPCHRRCPWPPTPPPSASGTRARRSAPRGRSWPCTSSTRRRS